MAETLSGLAEQCGLELQPETEQLLERYLELLARWGRSINLTSDPDPGTVLTRQLPDAFQLARLLDPGSERAEGPLDPESGEGAEGLEGCLDVGAGAGLVAIPLALLRPRLGLTLLEPNQKKCAFLRTVAFELKLPVAVRSARLEAVEERFAIVMSRATWAPERWLEEARRVLEPGGRIVVFTRASVAFEGFDLVASRCYLLEGGAERCVSVVRER